MINLKSFTISIRPKRLIYFICEDLFSLACNFLLAIYFFRDNKYSKKEWIVLAGFILLWPLIRIGRKLFDSYADKELTLRFYDHIKAYCLFLVVVFISYLLFPVLVPKSIKVILCILGFPFVGIFLNLAFTKLKNQLISANKDVKYTLVAGVGNIARNVEKQLFDHEASGHAIKGFVNCISSEECAVEQSRVIGELNEINQYLKVNVVDEIVIALPGNATREIQSILSVADYHGIRVKFIPDYHEIFGDRYKITRYGQMDVINVRQLPLDYKYSFILKYVFDKIFSALILILLAPLFLLISIAIKIDSPGPVFYCPIRIGKAGKAFKVYKFRSMCENDITTGGVKSTQIDDPRITKLGKILRKYSLDELPQFINVFLGNMSVVGPRPHRRFLNQQLQECVYKYMIRHYVKPGITGWAQVNGWRGPTDTEEQKRQRTLHDLWYLENWSIMLDMKIIFMTIFSKKAHASAF